MSIAADPAERLGDYDIVTVTVPVEYVMLCHHGRDVRIEVDRLRKFAHRWGQEVESFRYIPDGFSWIEHMALIDSGWSATLSSGMSWPTQSLASAVHDWEHKLGIV